MKTTEEYLAEVLKDELEVITATELKAHMGEILTQASMGKSFCIKRKGKIMGYLTLSADLTHTIDSRGRCETHNDPLHLARKARRIGIVK